MTTTTTTDIKIESSFNNNISTFDKEDSYSDITFIIPGLNKPLKLHRMYLGMASKTFDGLFKKQGSSYVSFDPATQKMTWTCKKMETDTTYRRVLVKWLRFCYGEDQTFSIEECPAAVTILQQLQLKVKEDVKSMIEKHMTETTKENVDAAAQLLRASSADEDSEVNETLGKFVFTEKHMETKPNIVDECLMVLPADYLNIVEFRGIPPNELNEFLVRRKYVRFNRNKLSEEKKREVLMGCKQGILDDEEVEAIQKEGLLSDSELVELCKRGLKTWKEEWKEKVSTDRDRMKKEIEENKKKLEQMKKEQEEAMKEMKRELSAKEAAATREKDRATKAETEKGKISAERDRMKKEIEENKKNLEQMKKQQEEAMKEMKRELSAKEEAATRERDKMKSEKDAAIKEKESEMKAKELAVSELEKLRREMERWKPWIQQKEEEERKKQCEHFIYFDIL